MIDFYIGVCSDSIRVPLLVISMRPDHLGNAKRLTDN